MDDKSLLPVGQPAHTVPEFPRSRARATLLLARAALTRDTNLSVEGYCEHPDCAAREVSMLVKDYDHSLVGQLVAHGFTCPLCGRVLRCDDVGPAR